MTLDEIYKLTKEYNKDDSLSTEQKFARIQILKAEATGIIENNRIEKELQTLVDERRFISEDDYFTSILRNSDDVETFSLLSKPDGIMKIDAGTQSYIGRLVNEVINLSQSRILKIANELDKGLELNGVVSPLNEKYELNNEGKATIYANNKNENELKDDYTKGYQKIQELFNNGIIDLKTKMLAEKQIKEIYTRCTKYSFDNLGLDLKLPNTEIINKSK